MPIWTRSSRPWNAPRNPIPRKPMPKKRKKLHGPPLHLALPATSANLGPAFDAAALAMDLYITIDARAAAEFSIRATGRDLQICETLENHLVLTTYREILQA